MRPQWDFPCLHSQAENLLDCHLPRISQKLSRPYIRKRGVSTSSEVLLHPACVALSKGPNEGLARPFSLCIPNCRSCRPSGGINISLRFFFVNCK